MSAPLKALRDRELLKLLNYKTLSYNSTYLQPNVKGLSLVKPKGRPPFYMYALWSVP
jgi:hypothetical protein